MPQLPQARSLSSEGDQKHLSPGQAGPLCILWDCLEPGPGDRGQETGERAWWCCPLLVPARTVGAGTAAPGLPGEGHLGLKDGQGDSPGPPLSGATAALAGALISPSQSPRPWPGPRLRPVLTGPCPRVARLSTESRPGLAESREEKGESGRADAGPAGHPALRPTWQTPGDLGKQAWGKWGPRVSRGSVRRRRVFILSI